jgi:hypothetical protein
MVDITEISAILAAAGVLAGVVYYILDMRHQMQVRQTSMVMELYSTFGSTEFQRAYQAIRNLEFEDYADYMKRYGKDVEVRAAMWTVTIFFEGIGILAKRRLAKMELVADLFGYPIIKTWEKVASPVKGLREADKAATICEWFEYLYNEMKKREQRQ